MQGSTHGGVVVGLVARQFPGSANRMALADGQTYFLQNGGDLQKSGRFNADVFVPLISRRYQSATEKVLEKSIHPP